MGIDYSALIAALQIGTIVAAILSVAVTLLGLKLVMVGYSRIMLLLEERRYQNDDYEKMRRRSGW